MGSKLPLLWFIVLVTLLCTFLFVFFYLVHFVILYIQYLRASPSHALFFCKPLSVSCNIIGFPVYFYLVLLYFVFIGTVHHPVSLLFFISLTPFCSHSFFFIFRYFIVFVFPSRVSPTSPRGGHWSLEGRDWTVSLRAGAGVEAGVWRCGCWGEVGHSGGWGGGWVLIIPLH